MPCARRASRSSTRPPSAGVKGNQKLTDLYAKSILFDYSYRYFYGDGFGKDYQILNLDEGRRRTPGAVPGRLPAVVLPAAAALSGAGSAFRPFNIEKPLWIFVGGSVTATLAKPATPRHRRDPAVPGTLRGGPRREHPAHRARAESGDRHGGRQEPFRRALRYLNTRSDAGAGLRRDAGDAFQRARRRRSSTSRT
jgi:hypothetical protein